MEAQDKQFLETIVKQIVSNPEDVNVERTVDEMGVMVGFDGNVDQIEQLCNFSYTQTGYTIQVYNTVNPDVFRGILEQTYTINWGDGLTSGLTVNSGIIGTNLVDAEQTVDTLSRWIKSGLDEGATHVDTSIDDVSKTGMMRENQREYKGREGLRELLQQIGWYEHVISFDDWERIDQEELKKGRMGGKSREKIVSVDEMIEIARKRID